MRVFLYLLVVVAAVGCNAEQAKSKQYTYRNLEQVDDFATKNDTLFANVLTVGGLNLHVYEVKHPTATELIVHTDEDGKMLSEISKQLPGNIVKIDSADLNNNHCPELYVWCKTSADSCSLLAFELQGNNYYEIVFPQQTGQYTTDYLLTPDGIAQKSTNKNHVAITTHFQLDGKANLVMI